MPLSFLPNNAFPLPASLAPKLVGLGLENTIAEKVSRVYISSALNLKKTCETEYVRACSAFVTTSDDRGYSSKELRSKLLTALTARYMQALLKCRSESVEKAEAFLRKSRKSAPRSKVVNTPLSEPPKRTGVGDPKLFSFSTVSPAHAFPHTYPPPARPDPISFVTHIPLVKTSKRDVKGNTHCDLDECIIAFSRLSLERSQFTEASDEPTTTASKPRSRTYTASKSKLAPRLSPSAPRLVSPALDTSVAVPHQHLPRGSPFRPSPVSPPRTQNIDIPRASRRKVCSIPYRRPIAPPSTSPESPESHLSRSIRRTPSLVSDRGSEASSPSTPPDFPPILMPPSTLAQKDTIFETVPLEQFLVPRSMWQDIDFGTELYG